MAKAEQRTERAEPASNNSDNKAIIKAFACVLVAFAVAVGCTAFIQRRRGPATAVQLSEASRWMYRRVRDLSWLDGRGAHKYDPHMASRVGHARARKRREMEREARRERQRRRREQCYSLATAQCSTEDEVPVNGSCVHPAADHLLARDSGTICGHQLPRSMGHGLRPCWQEGANISCLPSFFLIGEMRCGTTTLYQLLGAHPDVALPTIKEPRYLTLPNYRHHTGSWYASHFGSAAGRPDALALDASPTMFNAPLLAPTWVRKWLPQAKHIVLLREPSQRTYSHWRAGVQWLRASPCFRIEPLSSNATVAKAQHEAAAAAAADGEGAALLKRGSAAGLPAPVPEIRMMREVFSFDAVARLGVLEVVLRECGASSGWGREGGVLPLSNRSKACILNHAVGKEVAALWHARQALAAKRSEDEKAAYVEGMKRVSVCSEFMLRSGAGVWRSSRYAANLETWRKHFPLRSQLHVLASEDLERDPAKARLDGNSEGGGGGATIGPCDAPEERAMGTDGVSRYKIEPATEALLKQFFAPYNERLFALLGRTLAW